MTDFKEIETEMFMACLEEGNKGRDLDFFDILLSAYEEEELYAECSGIKKYVDFKHNSKLCSTLNEYNETFDIDSEIYIEWGKDSTQD